MITIDEKIEKLGEAFRGLWKTCELQIDGKTSIVKWSVTFVYDGKYVESEYCDSPHKAFDYVFKYATFLTKE